MTLGVTERGYYEMMTMNRTRVGRWLGAAAVAIALTGGALPALSQEIGPEQLALARKYVDITNKAQLYEVVLVTTAQRTSQVLSQQNPDLTKPIDDAIGKVLETYKGKDDELFNQIARIYAAAFTTDELQQIVNFYSSPAGQKLAGATLDNNQAIQKVMTVYTSNLSSEFLRKVRADLKAQGMNL